MLTLCDLVFINEKAYRFQPNRFRLPMIKQSVGTVSRCSINRLHGPDLLDFRITIDTLGIPSAFKIFRKLFSSKLNLFLSYKRIFFGVWVCEYNIHACARVLYVCIMWVVSVMWAYYYVTLCPSFVCLGDFTLN